MRCVDVFLEDENARLKANRDASGLRLKFASENNLPPETPGIYIGQRNQEIPTGKQRSELGKD